MLELITTADGVLLPVKAFPKARSNSINGVHDGRLKIAVTAAPEKGKANAAIIKLLAGCLGLSKHNVELLRGDTSQLKTFLLRDAAPRLVMDALAEHGISR